MYKGMFFELKAVSWFIGDVIRLKMGYGFECGVITPKSSGESLYFLLVSNG